MTIFDPGSLRTSIASQLAAADVPADARNAFVAVVTRDAAGNVVVLGAVSAKVGDHWTVKGVAKIDHDRKIEGGFEVKATW
jgi:hypothetical protein